MTQRESPLTITIDTDPDRAIYFGSNPNQCVWPAQLSQREYQLADFTRALPETPDMSTITGIEVRLIGDAKTKTVSLPILACRGITKFMRNSNLRDDDFNCMSFAWAACNLAPDGLQDATYMPIEGADQLSEGDLVSVGTITNWHGFDFVKLIKMKHWAVYLRDGMTLNVTGQAGILAGTPTNNFQAIYPGTTTYKVKNYQQGPTQ